MYNEYQFSPIRMKFPRTGEVFNIGVIVMDEHGENREIRCIDNFDDISKCLRIDEPSSHNFILNLLNSQYNTEKFTFGQEFSNTMHVESPDWLNTEKTISDAADELYEELVTIKRAIHSHRHISEYTPTKIVTSLKSYANNKGYKRIDFRKRIKVAFNKKIDAIVYSDDEMQLPVIGVDVCTPAVEQFIQNTAFAAMALQAARRANMIKKPIIYMPEVGDMTPSLRRDYFNAKAGVEEQDIMVIDTKDSEEFFGFLNQQASSYGTSLF